MFFEEDKEDENYLQEKYFLKDGLLDVNEVIWAKIKLLHPRRAVIDYIHSLIVKYDIPYPYREYTELQIKDDFSKLKNTPAFSILTINKPWSSHRLFVPDFDYHIDGTYVTLQPNTVGRSCSDNFAQKERMNCIGKTRGLSPADAWKKDPQTFRFLYNMCEKVNTSSLISSIGNSSYIASQFAPMCAKAIYDIFQCKNVLDLAMGWGDRLTGALASDIISYTGIDPNTRMHPIYESIRDYYKHDKKTKFICSPAEDVEELEPNQFDMIFTSPPYFDREMYVDEDTQSWKRYGSNVDSWLNGFLFKVMEKSYNWLQDGGRLILNINDVSDGPFCGKMLDYALELGFSFEGAIGYGMASRPGKGMLEGSAFVYEPMFVWTKGTPKTKMILETRSTLF